MESVIKLERDRETSFSGCPSLQDVNLNSLSSTDSSNTKQLEMVLAQLLLGH